MIAADLVVVGAGPAGLAAAAAGAAAGLSVVVLDDNPQPGGQYLRQPGPGFGRLEPSPYDSEPALTARLLAAVAHPAVRWLPGATVWDLPAPGVVAFAAGERSGRARAEDLILAPGGYDRPVPFPGWTLPGVVTAGGVQNLVKGQRLVPPGPAVVAGSGPLLLVVAVTLLRAGVSVAAVVEAAPLRRRLPAAVTGLLAAPRLLGQGMAYRARLAASGVPVLEGWTVLGARGRQAVDRVVIAPVDEAGFPDRAARRVIPCATLVTGFGLTPSTELARLAGCRLVYDDYTAALVPARGDGLETSVDGLRVAGDGARLGGAALAVAEGELAALSIAAGRDPGSRVLARRRAAALARVARLARFRRALATLYAPPADWLSLVTPETLVCRCEDVEAAQVSGLLAGGASLARVKAQTRCALGRCQGRNCLSTLAALAARARGIPVAGVAWPRARPPARPVPLGDLLSEPIPPPDLPADPHLPRSPRPG